MSVYKCANSVKDAVEKVAFLFEIERVNLFSSSQDCSSSWYSFVYMPCMGPVRTIYLSFGG